MLITPAFLLLAVVAYVNALGNIQQIQQPMPGVQVPNLAGQWYAVFRKAPCSWSSSEEFANIRPFYQYDGKAAFIETLTWGTEFCSKVFGKMVFTNVPGVLLLKDEFGDSLSGRYVVIGTDYKSFLVLWVCTKVSVFGDKCDDAGLFIQTRVPQPGMKTISKINAVMMQRFGLTVSGLKPILQTAASPCFVGPKKSPPFKG